uniref:Uncharacterized protein n=1 Tax=viral metagenome TaxID=1070528 RepID=A0A6C0CSU2_9ZZZZ
MNLIVLIVVTFLLWLGFMLYKAYSGIIDELKQVREKCVTTGSSQSKETFKTSLNEKPIENELEKIPRSMVKGLSNLLKIMA